MAGLVGRSESWLSQVERGLRGVDSYPVLRDLARVLRVDITVLTEAEQAASHEVCRDVDQHIAAIERALLVGGGDVDIADVQDAVAQAHLDYQAARYDQVLAALPSLIAAIDGDEAARVAGYTVVAKTLTKIGTFDLALVAADRARTAAGSTGDPTDLGMAVYQVVCALLPTSRAELAEQLAVASAGQIEVGRQPSEWSVAGALWLIGAVAAARRGDAEAATERLDNAESLAIRIGEDANHRWTAFGPTNVAIHRVSVAVELGDAPAALKAADSVALDRLPPGLRSRRVQVQLDIAWAQAQRRRDAEALVALLEVERAAPQVTRACPVRVVTCGR
ncbi:helix-turn-helix domain-containing protein [Pseudonocardia alaniniphila]|uniref:Helix-turn-helix domain-containing protein n=1 Tax=Pseudonocardia alaniniphila TaxID=75291 RepID=A0ABS9TVF2_9PSEU|nr:helix-turn-helix domain-containing protein [Pseudonocardia alaniniphila]